MKKQLLLYCCFISLISLTSCADKYERSINKHFNKFILIDDLKDYEIAKIERAYVTEANIKQGEIQKKILEIQKDPSVGKIENEIFKLSNFYRAKPYAISRFDNYNQEKIVIEGPIAQKLIKTHEERGLYFSNFANMITYKGYWWKIEYKYIDLSANEIIERKTKIKDLEAKKEIQLKKNLTAIDNLKSELNSLKAVKNSKVIKANSKVFIEGTVVTGKNIIIYNVEQNPKGEIISVK